ncbi:U4/U6-U5 snRNP complex subunit SNU66 [Sporobolomyces koalae]|uniref:U4/U6-U5 snRNP complex subunit SNU66 n=1 Tax=Sporobolomyces koalae TaxID=500713 RepID=UPI00317C5880
MADVNPTGQWKESLTLEETNKVRVSLGLKPLKDPNPPAGGPTEEARELDGDQLAELNYRKTQDSLRRQQDEKDLQARLDKARNHKERHRKLVGTGLADQPNVQDDNDDADTKSWIRKQKKRAKELAAKREQEQAEQDRLAEEELRQSATKYGERDLSGIKVSHDADAFEDGEEHVLTLKDSRILDDEDDELHNLNLTENAKHKAAVELKKKGNQAGQYTGYDDDEFAEDGSISQSKKGVLSKYDEGFEGAVKADGFRLGAAPVAQPGRKSGQADRDDADAVPTGEREKVKLSMEYTKSFNTDYLQEGDAGFKKPKLKKKKRPARTTSLSASLDNAGENGDSMQVDGEESTPRSQIERASLDSSNLIDDDDLAVSLARQRREAAKRQIKEMKERTKLALEQQPVRIKQEDEDQDDEDDHLLPRVKKEEEAHDRDADDVLVMDDTSEFVRNIKAAAEQAASAAERKQNAATRVKQEDESKPADMRGLESVQPRIKQEEDDAEPLAELSTTSASRNGGWNTTPQLEDGEEQDALMRNLDERTRDNDEDADESKPSASHEDDDGEFGTTGGEKLVSRGLASTLSILRHQGLMKPRTPEELEKERQFKEREAWLNAQRQRDAERERERIESRNAGDRIDQRQREYENKLRDQRDAQAAMEAYKNYKPVVELKYHDEFGRDMTPKEAWKHLSHSFHGHGHGSKKTEKRLQKIENERKAAAMAAGDTPNSTAAAFAARAEATGSATMILGVGNNNSAPMQQKDESLSLSKKAPNSKGKAKSNANNGAAPVFDDIPMRPLPLPSSSASRDLSETPEPSSASSTAPSARKGFAPVRSFSPAVNNTREGTPKFAPISVAVKRKAAEAGEDSPASKRRA